MDELSWRLTWSRLSKAIAKNCLAKVVAANASEVIEFQEVLKLTTESKCALKDMMLNFASKNKDDTLSNMALNIEPHFASKKRNYTRKIPTITCSF